MARKEESRKIGKTTYIVKQFGASKGKLVLFRVSRLLGPVFAGMIKGGGFSANGIADALTVWSEKASVKDFAYLCNVLSSCTEIESSLTSGETIRLSLSKQFDSHFAGNYGEMLLWLKFALEVNFENFLGEMLKELGLSREKSPKTPRASESTSRPG